MSKAPTRQAIFSAADNAPRLSFVIAAMTLMATLILAVGLGLNRAVEDWQVDASGEITLELSADTADSTFESYVAAVAAAPGVQSASAITKPEMMAMLEPWLGPDDGAVADRFALPLLIAVKTDGTVAAARFEEMAKQAGLSVMVDDHGATLAALLALSRTVQALIAGLVALIGATTIATVSFATRAAIDGHRSVIETVHQIGADDTYIAAEFQRHFLRIGLIGGFAGWLVAGAVGSIIIWVAPHTPGFENAYALPNWGYGLVAALPFVLALVTTLSARFTVLARLREQL